MITDGFFGRRRDQGYESRIPPGQSRTDSYPVLSFGPTPRMDLTKWRLVVRHEREELGALNWADFNALKQTEFTRDIHCVTRWTKLDMKWKGVLFDDILSALGIEPATGHVTFHGADGYTTNLPLADLRGDKAMAACATSVREMLASCRALISLAAAEGRIVLTRDRGLLQHKAISHACYIHATAPDAQFGELVARLGLQPGFRPFTRCMECNAPLAAVDKAEVLAQLPPSVRERQQHFRRCTGCGRVFWEGSHWRRMRSFLSGAGEAGEAALPPGHAAAPTHGL